MRYISTVAFIEEISHSHVTFVVKHFREKLIYRDIGVRILAKSPSNVIVAVKDLVKRIGYLFILKLTLVRSFTDATFVQKYFPRGEASIRINACILERNLLNVICVVNCFQQIVNLLDIDVHILEKNRIDVIFVSKYSHKIEVS
jgi:hypothetical protein